MRTWASAVKVIAIALALAARPAGAFAQTQPFIGQVMVAGFNFCPVGWLPMNGQFLRINDYATLFQLLGTTYGGDGQTNFALPIAKPIFTATGAPFMTCIAWQGVWPSQN